MSHAVEQQSEAPEWHEAAVTQRNRRWAERVEKLLRGEGDILIVVGALHLVGEDGLPALLRAKGLRVEGP